MQVETKACRHGRLSFYTDDSYVGKSLKLYGDYSEDEVSMFKNVLRPDDVAVVVGANIGALVVPMAKLCREVYAFEPQPENYQLLVENVRQNGLDDKVHCFRSAVGHRVGKTKVPSLDKLGHVNFGCVEVGSGEIEVDGTTLDLILSRVDDPIRLIMLDCEGSERDVLLGAQHLIKKNRPLLYVENDRQEKSAELVGWLIDHDYRCWWHKVPLFYDGNFFGEKTNVFGIVQSQMMICVPDEKRTHVSVLDEVADMRVDPQMYQREYKRMLKRLDRDDGTLDDRSAAAHYASLMGHTTMARQLLRENLAIDPVHVQSLKMTALLDLQDGNFRDGWVGYEMRYMQNNPESFGWRPHTGEPWQGQETDEVVLIWAEQGFGDSIMFVRFMDEVLRRAPNAILEVQAQLFELIELSNIVPKGRLFRLGRTMPEYKYHCAIPSLPSVLKIEREDQIRREPYLVADPKMVDRWAKLYTPRIGLCLKGGVASERAYSRDMPQEVFDPVARRFGPFVTLENHGQYYNYAETAATIKALDMVITVDTSVAHLAGALGAKTFLMLSSDPDFRWQRHRSDTPWYPSMTIFRQRDFMDWSWVTIAIAAVLENHSRKLSEAAE